MLNEDGFFQYPKVLVEVEGNNRIYEEIEMCVEGRKWIVVIEECFSICEGGLTGGSNFLECIEESISDEDEKNMTKVRGKTCANSPVSSGTSQKSNDQHRGCENL